ncbi:MAG: hypothetical protein WAV95_07110 [Azonexus sp.]
MNRSLLVAALLAVALTACNKKEEAPTALPAPAVAPTLPSAGEATLEQSKPADGATLNALPQAAPAAESKPAN